MAITPERIGRYRILSRLATGGMAEIFLACEQESGGLQRLVVIKRILPHLAANPGFVDLFHREARIMAGLSHPNVVQIHELAKDNGQYFIALEYIHGLTAQELVDIATAENATLPVQVAVSIVAQACRGLHAAHEMRNLTGQAMELVHRDVSPNNLMITVDGHVKMVDFGIAKPTAIDDEETYGGELKGKWAYMSPEQCRNEPLDRRTDIFTLGIVLWELSTGLRLFKRENEMEMMHAVTEGTIPLPSAQNPEVSAVLEAIIFKALERDRSARFDTAEEMRLALIEAAEIDELDLSEDAVAAFVEDHAGDALQARRNQLTTALAEGLSGEWPPSPEGADFDHGDDIPTIVRRPARTTDVEAQEIVDDFVERAERSRQGVMVAAFAIAVIVAALLATGLLPEGPEKPGDSTFDTIHDPSGSTVAEVPPLTIGWPPFEDSDTILAETEPLHRYLEEALGQPVETIVCEDYDSCGARLLGGELDAALLSPMLLLQTVERDAGAQPIAVRLYDGAATYDSVLLVRVDDPARDIEDLEGRRFCLIDRQSTSGFVLPRAFLADAGYDPDTFIGDIRWTGTHSAAIADLLDERCDVAATHSGALYSGFNQGLAVGRLRYLATTGVTPRDAVVASPQLEEGTRDRLRDALLGFDPHDLAGVDRIGAALRMSGFSAFDPAAYDALRGWLTQARPAP